MPAPDVNASVSLSIDAAGGERDLITADDERRAVFIGEHHGLLGREPVAAAVGEVLHVSRRRVAR